MAWVGLLALLLAGCNREPEVPLASGVYTFQHKFAEHPAMPSIAVKVEISGRRIVISNAQGGNVFARGELARGELAWHAKTRQWFIATHAMDGHDGDIGGCSDGPEVVDLDEKIYWTC